LGSYFFVAFVGAGPNKEVELLPNKELLLSPNKEVVGFFYYFLTYNFEIFYYFLS
jgi:hypothetical protein